jgi:hypothetical protein
MWGEVRLLNGYSPIKPAGVARGIRFRRSWGNQSGGGLSGFWSTKRGPGGKLAQVGVDGIIVANEFGWVPNRTLNGN